MADHAVRPAAQPAISADEERLGLSRHGRWIWMRRVLRARSGE
ncbi:hypothetical protein ACS3YM_04790 [Nocardia sp. N13]